MKTRQQYRQRLSLIPPYYELREDDVRIWTQGQPGSNLEYIYYCPNSEFPSLPAAFIDDNRDIFRPLRHTVPIEEYLQEFFLYAQDGRDMHDLYQKIKNWVSMHGHPRFDDNI